jgi:hypothetical protein
VDPFLYNLYANLYFYSYDITEVYSLLSFFSFFSSLCPLLEKQESRSTELTLAGSFGWSAVFFDVLGLPPFLLSVLLMTADPLEAASNHLLVASMSP